MYAFVIASCCSCGAMICCNPNTVPSIRMLNGKPDASGSREPLCRACAEALNVAKAKAGLEPVPIRLDAYDAIPEEELPF